MSNGFKYVQHNFPVGTKIFLGEASPLPGYGPVEFYKSQKPNVFFCTLCAFSILVQFSKSRSRKTGSAPASPAAHLQCSTARIWRDLSAASFCSCKLLWRSGECVSLPYAHPDTFAVMNCCVVALSLFSSDSLTWTAYSLYSVQCYMKQGEWM